MTFRISTPYGSWRGIQCEKIPYVLALTFANHPSNEDVGVIFKELAGWLRAAALDSRPGATVKLCWGMVTIEKEVAMSFKLWTPFNIYEEINEYEAVAYAIHDLAGELPREKLGQLAEDLDRWASMDSTAMNPGDVAVFLGGKISVTRI